MLSSAKWQTELNIRKVLFVFDFGLRVTMPVTKVWIRKVTDRREGQMPGVPDQSLDGVWPCSWGGTEGSRTQAWVWILAT